MNDDMKSCWFCGKLIPVYSLILLPEKRYICTTCFIKNEQRLKNQWRGEWYQEYLKTDHWKVKKTKALERAHYRCENCGSNEHLQVHHRTYERIGEEEPDDLCVLCEDCHHGYHAYVRSLRWELWD